MKQQSTVIFYIVSAAYSVGLKQKGNYPQRCHFWKPLQILESVGIQTCGLGATPPSEPSELFPGQVWSVF